MITDGQARRIAAEWQAPNSPGIAALATSGAILDSTAAEVYAEVRWFKDRTTDYAQQSLVDLQALLTYVERKGTRPAPAGWSNLWDNASVVSV